MNKKILDDICSELPGAQMFTPWGDHHEIWKIGGKIFASVNEKQGGVSVKADSIETSQMLIETGVAIKAPYFHKSWINLPFHANEDELRYRIENSYNIIRNSLTKKIKSQLPV